MLLLKLRRFFECPNCAVCSHILMRFCCLCNRKEKPQQQRRCDHVVQKMIDARENIRSNKRILVRNCKPMYASCMNQRKCTRINCIKWYQSDDVDQGLRYRMDWRKGGRAVVDIKRKNYDSRIKSNKSECIAQTPHDLLAANLKRFIVNCKHSCAMKKVQPRKREEGKMADGCRSKHEKVVTFIIHGSPIKSKNDQTHE